MLEILKIKKICSSIQLLIINIKKMNEENTDEVKKCKCEEGKEHNHDKDENREDECCGGGGCCGK